MRQGTLGRFVEENRGQITSISLFSALTAFLRSQGAPDFLIALMLAASFVLWAEFLTNQLRFYLRPGVGSSVLFLLFQMSTISAALELARWSFTLYPRIFATQIRVWGGLVVLMLAFGALLARSGVLRAVASAEKSKQQFLIAVVLLTTLLLVTGWIVFAFSLDPGSLAPQPTARP